MKKITNQHGDLLFEKVDEIPSTAKKVEAYKGYILERGEGVHTHVLEDVEGIEVFEDGSEIYVRVKSQTKINHEEHGIQILEPGIHKKIIERVWDYEKEEARRTID